MTITPMGQILTDLAAADPHRVALVCGDQEATRAELESRANRLARSYAEMGVTKGDLVTVGLPNGIEFYEVCFALWKLGATPQPVSWRLPDREREQIVELANPPIVVGVEGSSAGRPNVPPSFEPDSALSDAPMAPQVAPAWRAMTSGGSTGRPKLIVTVRPRGEFDTSSSMLKMLPHQTQLVAGPLYHSAPFNSMYGLFIGQRLVIMPKFDPVEALHLIEREHIGFAQFVPTMLQRMWRVLEQEQSRWDLSSLETVWHMAAPCPVWLKQAWIDLIGAEKLWELYAGSEGQSVTCISGVEWLDHEGSVGRPLFGELKVVDEAGRAVPPGTLGEVYLRRSADGVKTYYYVGAQARSLPDGWESLGDMGWVDTDGFLYLTDRLSDMVLSGGANIYPAEVEAAILEHPHVLTCAVVGLPDTDLGQRVHAVVQATGNVSAEDLSAFVNQRLVRYKVPRSFRFVDHSVRDDAGKVRRSQVREQEIALHEAG